MFYNFCTINFCQFTAIQSILFLFFFQASTDRFYKSGSIKIRRNDVAILKKMNENVLQKSKEHDYSFVCRLIGEVFDEETLRNIVLLVVLTSYRNWKKTAFARLDSEKYDFIASELMYFSLI